MPHQNGADRFGFIARPTVAPDATLYYPWVDGPNADPWNGTASVVVGVSRDRGQTFETHEVAPIPNGTGGLWPLEASVGPDGTLHLVWMERGAGVGSVLWYSASHDGGATYDPPRLVGWPNGTAFLPWIAHAGPGRAVIAFYGAPEAVYPEGASEGQRWDAWALAVGGNGSSEPARVSPWPVKVGTFCPRGAACPQDRELLDYPAVTWRDGWVHVAFAASLLDEGAGPPGARSSSTDPAGDGERDEVRGGHSTNAHIYMARAPLP
jgi:hypothetical protein